MTETTEGSGQAAEVHSPQPAAEPAEQTGRAPGFAPASPDLAGFTPSGAAEYEKKSRDYLVALEQVSRAIAMQRNSDSVVPFHVQLAVDSLGKNPGQKFKRLSEFGALLVGFGLANLGVMLFGNSYTFKSALLVFIPLLIGCILYAYTWGHE